MNHPGTDFIVPVYQTEVEGIVMEIPKFASFDNRLREQCEAAVMKSGWYLEDVPTAWKTEHMCLTAWKHEEWRSCANGTQNDCNV